MEQSNLHESVSPSGLLVQYFLPSPQHQANIRTIHSQSPTAFSFDEVLFSACIVSINGVSYQKSYELTDILAPLNSFPLAKDLNTLIEIFKAKGVYPTQQELLQSAQSTKLVSIPEHSDNSLPASKSESLLELT